MISFFKNNSEDGLSNSQVTTLMAHIGTLTSVCMVQPMTDDFSDSKEKLRDSIKQREHVCIDELKRYSSFEDNNNENKENNNNNNNDTKVNEKSNFKRMSRLIEAPPSLLEYKDVLRRISQQVFTKRPSSFHRPTGKRFSIVPPPMTKTEEEEKTMNFCLTQRFIGWKV